MYEKYNSVLRFYSAESTHSSADAVPFLQKKCEQLSLGRWEQGGEGIVWAWTNNYATTSEA